MEHRQYEPIDMYSVGGHRIRLDDLLASDEVRRRLVLSTSLGRYNVIDGIERWYSVSEFFKNYATANIQPRRSTFEGTAYGSGTKYIVRVTTGADSHEIIPIYPTDFRGKKFRDFQLTPEALESRVSLEAFLLQRAVSGELQCHDIEVWDSAAWRDDAYETEYANVVNAEHRSWFSYHVLGRALTAWKKYRLRRENRRRREKQSARLEEHQPSTDVNVNLPPQSD